MQNGRDLWFASFAAHGLQRAAVHEKELLLIPDLSLIVTACGWTCILYSTRKCYVLGFVRCPFHTFSMKELFVLGRTDVHLYHTVGWHAQVATAAMRSVSSSRGLYPLMVTRSSCSRSAS